MTKVIKKLLSITLSLALMLTGFTFFGGAKTANAEGETDTIQIKVVDQNGNAVSGVSLTCTDEDSNDIDYGTSDEDGIAVHTIDKQFEFYDEDTEYTITSDDSEIVVSSPIVFTIISDYPTGMFYKTVNNEAYTGGVVNLVIQSDDPQPTGFEITFDPGDEGMLNIDEKTATTGEDGKLTSLPTPTVEDEDLVFTKWIMYTEEDEEVEVTTDTVFTDNTTVYAQYESVWEWNPTDFTYGTWATRASNEEGYSTDYEKIYPGNDDDAFLRDSLNIVTGFSDIGLAKAEKNHDLIIPKEDINNKRVEGVGYKAFYAGSGSKLADKKIESVTFPEGVKTSNNVYCDGKWESVANRELTERGSFVIGAQAFGYNNIEYLDVPEGVLSIGQGAFLNNQLHSIKLPSTLMVINTQAFAATNKRETNQIYRIDFPKETDFRLSIRNQAFFYCALEEVTLPKDTLQVFMHATQKTSAFTGNKGKEETDSTNRVELMGGVVYMYMEQTPDIDTSLIAHTENPSLRSANMKLFTDSSIVSVKQAVKDAEDALSDAWASKDDYDYAEPNDKENALNNAEAKAETAASAAEAAQKSAETAKSKYEEDSTEANILEESVYEAKNTGLYANQVLAEVKSEAAKKASDKAATMTSGDAAVAAAQVAADKANEALAAANKVVATMKELGYGDDDASDDMKEDLAAAEAVAKEANTSANNANNALAAAKTAAKSAKDKAAADAAEKARQGVYNAKLPKVKISKPKAAKKAVTVKWKKLSKKNQKKAQKIEVWVCPNKKFAAADTKMKMVSKKKASVKIKGLGKKKTYYVKVRSIKTVNGVKNVGKWSKVKKVKTK